MKVARGRIVTVVGALLAFAGLALSMSSPGVGFGSGTDPNAGKVKTVTAQAGESSVDAGESTVITVNVVDANGDPVVNTDCTFSIKSQPGTDASVDPATGTTDANGDVTTTLHVGSTPGTIEVEADCGGVTATVSVSAVAGATTAPPASLPSTGVGLAESDGGMNLPVAALLVLAGLALMGVGLVAQRRELSQ